VRGSRVPSGWSCLLWLCAAVWGFAPTAEAGVQIDIDRASLNQILGALTAQEVEVAVTRDRSLTVRIDEIRVLGFSPSSETHPGHIDTSVRLIASDIGLAVTVEPQLSLHVVEEQPNVLELRFDRVELPLPLVGQINLAPFLEPTRLPADYIWSLDGVSGPARVRSRLSDIAVGRENIRFTLELEVLN